MPNTTQLLEAALEYARRLGPVFPLFTPRLTAAGVWECDCPQSYKDRGDCSPGKHPRTRNGSKDATRDEAQIRRWWGQSFPQANIGLDLAGGQLLDIGPDDLGWQQEFVQRGLDPTFTFASSGPGHMHYLYRRPEFCPTWRICKQHEYDILSSGYVVMPGSLHIRGERYLLLDDRDPAMPPFWAMEMLAEAANRPKVAAFLAGEGVAEGAELERIVAQIDPGVWNGTRYDDRSTSLVAITGDAAKAGANGPTLIAIARERDETLGFNKYASRSPEAAQRAYEELAVRALALNPPNIHLNGHGPQVHPTSSRFPLPQNMAFATLSPQGQTQYVEDLIRPGRIVVVAAEEGSGKSYAFPGELGIRIATAGGTFANTWPIVENAGVLVLSEMPEDEDIVRQGKILASLQLEPLALDGKYWRLDLMTAADDEPALSSADWRDWVLGWCREQQVKVIMIDTATGATEVDPWGRSILAVYRNLRGMLKAYPDLALVLLVHCRKPQSRSARAISDVLGEWGRWCDVVVLQERDGPTRTKLSSLKRVRTQHRIIADQLDGLLQNAVEIGQGPKPKASMDEVVEAVSANEGLTIANLAAVLSVGKATAARYVKEGVQLGLFEQRKTTLGKGTTGVFLG
jgi:hypothetical protein